MSALHDLDLKAIAIIWPPSQERISTYETLPTFVAHSRQSQSLSWNSQPGKEFSSLSKYAYSSPYQFCRFGMTPFVEVGAETTICVVDPYC